MSPALGLVIADDHPIFRLGLRGMLESGGHTVLGEATNGAEAIALVDTLLDRGTAPDLVLMDLRMPGTGGVEATRRVVARGVRVLVLTTYDTDAAILPAIEAGATGYLLKDTPVQQLLEGIASAATGRTTLGPTVAARLVAQVREPAVGTLTDRETQVLQLVADGLTNAQIGTRLAIAESTVKTHLLRIFAKLGVDDRTRAATLAMARGLLADPDRERAERRDTATRPGPALRRRGHP